MTLRLAVAWVTHDLCVVRLFGLLDSLNNTNALGCNNQNKHTVRAMHRSIDGYNTCDMFILTIDYIIFWSSGIIECTCMLFTFENRVPIMR